MATSPKGHRWRVEKSLRGTCVRAVTPDSLVRGICEKRLVIMTGGMCPAGMGTCWKCGRGERCKFGLGGDGDGDGCSRAELRLDEIARCDRSVVARWPSREIVGPPDHANTGQEICPLPVLRHVRQARPVWQGRYGGGRPWEPSKPDRTGDDASEKFGKGSIERRDRHGMARADQRGPDQTRSRR